MGLRWKDTKKMLEHEKIRLEKEQNKQIERDGKEECKRQTIR